MDECSDERYSIKLFLKKNRWAAAVLLLGLIFISMPEQRKTTDDIVLVEQPEPENFQSELEELLAQLDGAGSVKVLLSEATGSESVYQSDSDMTRSATSEDRRMDTVIITSENRDQTGLLVRTDPPLYKGAVILCQGADSAKVRLAVSEAVSVATGLTTDKISVLKMK